MARAVTSKVDFVGRWRLWFAISAVLLLVGTAAIALGNLNFGIDFEAGAKCTVASPDRQLGENEVREALPDFVAGDGLLLPAGGGSAVRDPVLHSGEGRA